MTAAVVIIFALLGLLLSGALNAIAIRWDARLATAFPPSYCLHKNHKVKRHYSILPQSFAIIFRSLAILTAKGRCPQCGGSIGWRYMVTEPIAALLFGYSAYNIGMKLELVAVLFLICILIIIVHTDLTDMIIPNVIVAAGIIGAILLRVVIHPLPLWDYAIAAFTGSGALLMIGIVGSSILKKEAMGGGDIKLYVFIGLLLGIKLTLLSLFLASVFGLIGGIVLIVTGANSRGKTIPFGPYIAAGVLSAYYWGNGIIDAYLSWIGL